MSILPAKQKSRTQALAELFRLYPRRWMDGMYLAAYGGRYAYRTRLSDLRRGPYFMTIRNRQRRVTNPDGSTYIVSEYMFEPEEVKTQAAACNRSLPLTT